MTEMLQEISPRLETIHQQLAETFASLDSPQKVQRQLIDAIVSIKVLQRDIELTCTGGQ